MFQYIGYIFICSLIVYVCALGVFGFLKDNFNFEISMGEDVFISESRGEDWMAIKEAKEEKIGGTNFAFDPQNSQNLYLASVEGIFQSPDRGKSFSSKKTQFKIEAESNLISNFTITKSKEPTSYSLVVDDSRKVCYLAKEPEIIYLISEEMQKNRLLVSYDGGESFESIFVSGKNDKITAFSADPFSARRIYVGTKEGEFLVSDDFGSSWQEQNRFSQPIKQIVANSHKEGEIYVLFSPVEANPFDYWSRRIPGKVKVSDDLGENFKDLEEKIGDSKVIRLPEIKEIVLDPSQNRVYFVSDSLLLKLDGKTMKEIKTISLSEENKITAFTIDPKNSNILYIGIGELIYVSENNGDDWQIIEPPTKGRIKDIKVNPINPDTLLLAIEKVF